MAVKLGRSCLDEERAMTAITRGSRLVAYPWYRPKKRIYVEVTRVAKDGTWADLRLQTWAVMWTKRQRLNVDGLPPDCLIQDWDVDDLDAQQRDYEAAWAAEEPLGTRPDDA